MQARTISHAKHWRSARYVVAKLQPSCNGCLCREAELLKMRRCLGSVVEEWMAIVVLTWPVSVLPPKCLDSEHMFAPHGVTR